MPIVYTQRYDGEWVDVTDEKFVACCDCGLVHKYEYIIISNRILRRVFRNQHATTNRRRSTKIRASIKALNRKKRKNKNG